ncbi:MAG: crossover junction endodeoxyribonuclease RuvC [Candidatus Komeilibacteria bacterium]
MTNRPAKKRILGIDPGFADTGFGILEFSGNNVLTIDYGSIKTAAGQPFPDRLIYIYDQVASLIKNYKPSHLAIEDLFFYKNITTAIKVSQARGVVLLAARQKKLTISNHSPLQVKQSLTGWGGADKKQMGKMIKTVLHLEKVPTPDDAADALAIAWCAGANLIIKK